VGLKDETVAVLGYGVAGPGPVLEYAITAYAKRLSDTILSSLNGWNKAVADGWKPGRLPHRSSCPPVRWCNLPDASEMLAKVKPNLKPGAALFFAWLPVYHDQTGGTAEMWM
jgi:ketol-acid reductoisomerase